MRIVKSCFCATFLAIFLLSFFITRDVLATKVYIYDDSKKPRCANLSAGYFLDFKTHKEIGFGSNDTVASDGAEELTEQELYDYTKQLGVSLQEASSVYSKFSSGATYTFRGVAVKTKNDVRIVADSEIDRLFVDQTGLLSTERNKARVTSRVICVLLAELGVVNYIDTGIAGVVDSKTARNFVLTLLPLWVAAEQIRAEAEQYITDHNL